MARFRLSRLAQANIAAILGTSAERWGVEGSRRYAALLKAAMLKVASSPEGPTTRTRAELTPNLRSFHIRHARGAVPAAKVRRPAHILYYRVAAAELIEIVRVLHERMEPGGRV